MHDNKPKISVVVITKNVEKEIIGFLESVKWADEVVVVDDDSTDKTREICKTYKTKVIVHRSDLKFDIQRNIGIDNAANDWIMQTDSDEIIPQDTGVKIREAISDPEDFVAFKLIRKDYFFKKCISEAYMLKVFNRKFARYEELGNRHEKINVKGKIGYIKAVVEHYTYEGISDFVKKQIYYADSEAETLMKEKGILSWKKIRYNLTIKPLKLFWKLYFKKKYYKYGQYGFIWSLLQVIRRIIIYMKYWEIVNKKYNK